MKYNLSNKGFKTGILQIYKSRMIYYCNSTLPETCYYIGGENNKPGTRFSPFIRPYSFLCNKELCILIQNNKRIQKEGNIRNGKYTSKGSSLGWLYFRGLCVT